MDKDSRQVLSREEAAERCGVAENVLAEWERGIDGWLFQELTEILETANFGEFGAV